MSLHIRTNAVVGWRGMGPGERALATNLPPAPLPPTGGGSFNRPLWFETVQSSHVELAGGAVVGTGTETPA